MSSFQGILLPLGLCEHWVFVVKSAVEAFTNFALFLFFWFLNSRKSVFYILRSGICHVIALDIGSTFLL